MFSRVVVLCAVAALCKADEANEDFLEADVRKVDSSQTVAFGAQIYSHFPDRYQKMFDKFGPVFKLVFWNTVWDVSAAAPAPIEADDDSMDRWVNTIYWNIAGDISSIQRTSNLLVNNSIQLVAAAQAPPNAYYATPNQIKKREEREKAKAEGLEIEEEEWTPEMGQWMKEHETEDDRYVRFISESVPDYAKFWASSIQKLHELNLTMPFVELTRKPDLKQNVLIFPDDYAASVKQIRQQIRLRGIADDTNKIVGPGTSSPMAAKPYIEAIVKDRESYDAVHAWGIRVKDTGGPLEEIDQQIQGFKQLVKDAVPPSWPSKPIIVTSFSFSPDETFHVFDEVEFNGDMETCYKKIHGIKQKFEDDLPNTMGQSPAIAVRLLASLFIQYSRGLTHSIYETLHDTPWSFSCDGLFDRFDRQKQLLVAFSSFLPYLPKDAVVVRQQWQNTAECFSVMLTSESSVVIGLSNPAKASCARSFSLSGLDVGKIADAFTVSYNNGTVSLGASDPSEALLLKLPLSYDVFPSEIKPSEEVVEFDIIIGPHASATVVFTYGENQDEETFEKVQALLDKPFEVTTTKTTHSEL